jgi:uroporphyrinogen-III decarboxylase
MGDSFAGPNLISPDIATPWEVDELARMAIKVTGGRHFILSSGCALSCNTKPENVQAMVEVAQKTRHILNV